MSNSVQLPPGWEAIYNQDAKRYYFVDHVNKTTQWEDPRLTHPFIWGDDENGLLRKLHAKFAQLPENVIREALLRHQFDLEGTKDELSAKNAAHHIASEITDTKNLNVGSDHSKLEQQQNRRHSSTSRRSGSPSTFVRSQQAAVDEFAFLAVKSKFSEVSDDIINDVLKNCNNDEEKACKEILNMGFNRNRQNAVKMVERIELSLEEKLKLKEVKLDEALAQLSLEFPSFDRQQIRQALRQADDDVTEARQILSKNETARRLASLAPTSPTTESAIVAGTSGGDHRRRENGRITEDNNNVADAEYVFVEEREKQVVDGGHHANIVETNRKSYGHKSHSSSTRKTEKSSSSTTSTSAAAAAATTVKRASSSTAKAATVVVPAVKITTEHVSALIKPNLNFDYSNRESIPRVSLALPPTPSITNHDESKAASEIYKSLARGPDCTKRNGPDARNRVIKSTLALGPNKQICAGPDSGNLKFASFRKYVHAS